MNKEKIAILGGGVGALSAAYALTKVPGWQDRYDITVYQTGWRLGGKGASSRRHFNGAWRIEEHGPHIWFGFYFNAFRIISEAYDYCQEHNLTPESPFQSWTDAFHPKRDGTFMEYVGRCWRPWVVSMPDRSGSPLEPGDPHIWSHILDAIGLLLDWHDVVEERVAGNATNKRSSGWASAVAKIYARVTAFFGQPVPRPQGESLLHKAHAIAKAPQMHPRARPSGFASLLVRLGQWLLKHLVKAFRNRLRRDIDHLLEEHADLRHFWEMLDIGATSIYGLLADGVLSKGYDAIEGIDFSRWLEKHGCTEYWSPPIHGIYDSGAHYENGKAAPAGKPNVRPASANLAAGTAVQALLRMFAGYSGAFSYKMQAGMGETVFTPLYLALKHLGVKFAFFHRTMALGLSHDRTNVDTVQMEVQAKVRGGAEAYEALMDPIGGIRCWPAAPLYGQLEDGAELERSGVDLEGSDSVEPRRIRTLSRGKDFDKIVLGISVAALPAIASELESDPRWKQMVQGVNTVQTQFVQLWATRTSEQLCGAVNQPVVEAFAEPYSTWLDMSQVLVREAWPASAGAQSIHYFVGPLEEIPGVPRSADQEAEHVKQQALEFLRSHILGLWPNAAAPSGGHGFDWNVLVAPASAAGEQRFDSQYWRANVQPTERYVLSTTRSKFCRLRSDDCGFLNLFLAGDWTRNGLNAGSVEAAVMSGIQAAQGVSGDNIEILGGYDEMQPQGTAAGRSPVWGEPRTTAVGR